MLTIKSDEPRKVGMDLTTQGIDGSQLNFTLRIKDENYEIGFPGRLISENHLEVDIPPLKSVMENVEEKTYQASLEVDDNDKYFIRAWTGEIFVEKAPEVEANLNEGKNMKTQISVNNVESKPLTEEKKWTKKDAIKFVQETKKKFADRDQKQINKFIQGKLQEKGFNIDIDKMEKLCEGTSQKPQKKQTKQTKKNTVRQTVNLDEADSKEDIVKYLKSKGMKNERTVNMIMENIDKQSGGDIESMKDIAKRMMEGGQQQESFNDMSSIQNYYSQMYSSQDNITEGSSSVSDEEAKSNMMQKIQQKKAELNNT